VSLVAVKNGIGSKLKKARDEVRAGLDTGVIALDEAKAMELIESLRNYSQNGIHRFEQIVSQDCLLMLQIFQEASRYNSGSHSSTVESLSEAIQILGSERFLKMLKRLVKRSHSIPEGQKNCWMRLSMKPLFPA
jgi:hypothetical protein